MRSGVSRVAVTFDSYNAATGTVYRGTWHADPGYNQAQSDPQDVAVVVLDKAVRRITPTRRPKAGSLGALSAGTRLTSVGYGAQSVTIDQGPTFHYADDRYVASGGLNALNPSWLRIPMNPCARRLRYLLRGFGGTELPWPGGRRDQHRGRHDHHRRLHVPVHQCRLPHGHRLGAGIPRAVRNAAIGSADGLPGTAPRPCRKWLATGTTWRPCGEPRSAGTLPR